MLTNSLLTNGSNVSLGNRPAQLSQTGSVISFASRRRDFSNGRVLSPLSHSNDTSLVEEPLPSGVEIAPSAVVRRRAVNWHAMGAELVKFTTHERVDIRFQAPVHLLIACETGMRRAGETFLEGVPRSTIRDFSRKLTFVPAGHEYREWQEPSSSTRLLYFYVDPAVLEHQADSDAAMPLLAPRLLFEDAPLLGSALKLKNSIENLELESSRYSEALGVVLAHEIVRLGRGSRRVETLARGGLAAWQQRTVATYIEEHLSDGITLGALAQLARLSPYHFCRAFKKSFGVPPHRYHTYRRIERAKSLLAKRTPSVTEIGLIVGFKETSSFVAAFRKATGLTPSHYRRTLE
jgi:AraC family transcriptional regulator